MALVQCNTHGELTPLERGMHALRSNLSVRAYAEKVGRAHKTVDHEVRAAKVLSACANVGTPPNHVALSEIHAAPSWLWPALVAAATAEEWTVDRVRRAGATVKDTAAPPGWVTGSSWAATRR